MHILYVLHVDFELPGVIEDWANENQFSSAYVRTFNGEELPSEESFDMLVIESYFAGVIRKMLSS